jgi:hypothetical protein
LELPIPADMQWLKNAIPGCDLYKSIFNLVDRVNYSISRFKFPHKLGGRNHPGGEGHCHKFAMMSILKNIDSAMKVVRSGEFHTHSLLCDHLATELYAWASNL